MKPTDAVEILLVEDNPEDVELTLQAMEKHHLASHVKVVNDGAQALDYLFGGGQSELPLPKVVFLDLKLPKVDGLEVLRRMKADSRTRMIPVVVLTSSEEESDVLESYKLGVNSYIVKLLDFEKFVESIAELGLYWVLLNRPPY